MREKFLHEIKGFVAGQVQIALKAVGAGNALAFRKAGALPDKGSNCRKRGVCH
ncbi:hypothetical protein D3C81_1799980 [compost metagenome]